MTENQPTTPTDIAAAPTQPQNHVVFIVHASVGSGHRSAARAIAQAFELLKKEHDGQVPSDLDVEVIDILDWGRHKFDGDRAASRFVGATRPVYDITWRYFFTGRAVWGGGTIWSKLMFSPFTEYVEQRRPMAVIATHIVAANAAVAARMETGQDFPIVSVPTDYETEGLWPHRCSDLFCVATESMAETLRARKVEDDRILITGIPTREDYRRTYDKAAVREKFGLPADKNVVLVLAGAYLPTPYLRFREAIDQVVPNMDTLEDLHIVFVAGADKAYEEHLHDECDKLGLSNVTILGYVTEMAALMAACNLVICKPGGLTVTECLCSQVPMILLGKAYGQEKINVEMLTSLGAAMHVTTPRELLDALRYVMLNPKSIEAMLFNGRFIRRPDAARDIAHATMELARTHKSPDDFLRKKNFVRCYWGDKPAHVR